VRPPPRAELDSTADEMRGRRRRRLLQALRAIPATLLVRGRLGNEESSRTRRRVSSSALFSARTLQPDLVPHPLYIELLPTATTAASLARLAPFLYPLASAQTSVQGTSNASPLSKPRWSPCVNFLPLLPPSCTPRSPHPLASRRHLSPSRRRTSSEIKTLRAPNPILSPTTLLLPLQFRSPFVLPKLTPMVDGNSTPTPSPFPAKKRRPAPVA